MLGAAAARRLRADGAQVTLFEAAPALGGLTSSCTWDVPDGPPVRWDRFYHVILGSDRRVLALLDEIGIPDVQWSRTRAACYAGGKMLPASSAAELLGLPFLGIVAKLRIALTVAWAALWPSGERFDRITAARWLRRWSGRQATERLWLPLLRAKLGESAERASATFIWSTMRRLATARFQGRGDDLFGYAPGGYATVLAAVAVDLDKCGVVTRTDAAVAEVRRRPGGGGVDVVPREGATETFDRVLVTTAAPLAARLVPELTEAERARLDAVEYLGVVCPSVLLRRSATGAYITYVTDPAPFTAVIEMSALVEPSELQGHTLVYLPLYAASHDPVFAESDAAIRDRFLPEFLAMYGLDESDVLAVAVSRARYVMPVPTPGYAGRVPDVRTSVPEVYLVGSGQITTGTLNVEQTLQLLDEAWPRLGTPRFE